MVHREPRVQSIRFMQRKGSHRRPKFREKLIHRGDQRSNQSSLPGNQDKHGGRNGRMLENKVKKKKKAKKQLTDGKEQ